MTANIVPMDHRPGSVPDYTAAALTMAWVVLTLTLLIVWGLWGFVAALALAWSVHLAIREAGARLERARAAWDARVEAAIARGRAKGR